MDNNQFNDNFYNNENNYNNFEDNNNENNVTPNNHKGILGILLGVCAVGIIVLVVVFIGFLTPKDSESKEKKYSPEVEEAHKKQLIEAIDTYTTATITEINNMTFGSLSGEETIYYIPVSTNPNDTCIKLANGTINPFGDKGLSYVAVVYRKEYYSYDYYFTFYDENGYSMELLRTDKISKNDIVRSNKINKNNITTQLIEGTTKIVVLETPKQNPNNSCTIKK